MLIKNAILVTQDLERRIFRGDLRISANRIVEITPVGAKSKIRTRPKKIINGKDWVILPGFIQTHVHLCQTIFRNLADDLELDRKSVV